MAAKKKLPVTHVLAKTLQLDRSHEFGGFKRGANVVRRALGIVANQERAPADEKIHAFLLGESFIGRLTRFDRRVNKLVVARPERKLVYQVLRFDQINWRMPRTFDAFVAQIERNFGSAMPFIRNQK